MIRCLLNTSEPSIRGSVPLLAALLFAAAVPDASAQTPERTLVRIEEDWVALIAEPDSATASPQILNVISPIQSTSGVFGLVQINHRGFPSFEEGGLQLQGWNGSAISCAAHSSKSAVLWKSSDRLRYTIAMELVSEGIRFEVRNGRSRTWGRFADQPVTITVPASGYTLANYSSDYSVEKTTVNLGAHRIDLLYLTEVRRVFDDGETETDTTDRVIHRYQLNVEDVSLSDYEQNPDEYNIDITE